MSNVALRILCWLTLLLCAPALAHLLPETSK